MRMFLVIPGFPTFYFSLQSNYKHLRYEIGTSFLSKLYNVTNHIYNQYSELYTVTSITNILSFIPTKHIKVNMLKIKQTETLWIYRSTCGICERVEITSKAILSQVTKMKSLPSHFKTVTKTQD